MAEQFELPSELQLPIKTVSEIEIQRRKGRTEDTPPSFHLFLDRNNKMTSMHFLSSPLDIPDSMDIEEIDLFNLACRMFCKTLNPTAILTVTEGYTSSQCSVCGGEYSGVLNCLDCGKDKVQLRDNPYRKEVMVISLEFSNGQKYYSHYEIKRTAGTIVAIEKIFSFEKDFQVGGKLADFFGRLPVWMSPHILMNADEISNIFEQESFTTRNPELSRACKALILEKNVPIIKLKPNFLGSLRENLEKVGFVKPKKFSHLSKISNN